MPRQTIENILEQIITAPYQTSLALQYVSLVIDVQTIICSDPAFEAFLFYNNWMIDIFTPEQKLTAHFSEQLNQALQSSVPAPKETSSAAPLASPLFFQSEDYLLEDIIKRILHQPYTTTLKEKHTGDFKNAVHQIILNNSLIEKFITEKKLHNKIFNPETSNLTSKFKELLTRFMIFDSKHIIEPENLDISISQSTYPSRSLSPASLNP